VPERLGAAYNTDDLVRHTVTIDLVRHTVKYVLLAVVPVDDIRAATIAVEKEVGRWGSVMTCGMHMII
jgi:hypothetical protein